MPPLQWPTFTPPFTHLAVERFGRFKVGLALVITKDKNGNTLHFIPRRCTLFGLPFPKFLLPTGESYEMEKDGRFHFNVTIKLPILGLMAAYKGWLEPEAATKELESVA